MVNGSNWKIKQTAYKRKVGDLLGGFRISEVSQDEPGVYRISKNEAMGKGFTLDQAARRLVSRQHSARCRVLPIKGVAGEIKLLVGG